MKPKQRSIEPKYNELIRLWLAALAGAQAKDLVAWLQGFADLDQAKPLLILHGSSGTGKTLLVKGLARIWQKTHIFHRPINAILQDYDVLPLAVLEEPDSYSEFKQASFLARSTNVFVERMYQAPVEVDRVRVIVMKNDDLVLSNRWTHRMIECQREARDFLDGLSREEITSWVQEDKIAAHVLAL